MDIPQLGEIAALGAAACWSCCSIPFTFVSKRISGTAVNAFKTVLASVILISVVSATHGLGAVFGADPTALLYLGASGVIGLSVADSLLFTSYTLIGPRVAFLLFSTSPFVTVLISWPLLGESPGGIALLGMSVTMCGILLVTLGRDGGAAESRKHYGRGILLAALAAVGMGVTVALAKLGMRQVEELPAHAFRMTAGAAGLLLAGLVSGRIRGWVRGFRTPRLAAVASVGTVLGPVIGVWLFLIGTNRTESAGVTMTLASTSPVLVIPLTWIFHGDRPTVRSVLGALIAVGGVAILFAR